MPACAADVYALFVDAQNGSNANQGTRSAPFRTIDAATNIDALAGRPRIYLCGKATFAESVRLPPNVSLFGGFECGSWNHTGDPARIVASSPSFVIRVEGSIKGVVFSDLDILAKDGDADGGSSLGVLVASSKAVFRRVTITAGKGANALASATPTNHSAVPPSGESSTAATGAPAKTCACAINGNSVGGNGGNVNAAGAAGSSVPPAQQDGAAGSGGSTCTAGGFGGNGKRGGSGGRSPPSVGKLTSEGWVPGKGGDGLPGDPGGGGGGGGGNTNNGGGGGACGGCGGNGGFGGKGGGASIAMALLASDVTFAEGTLQADTAGDGAAGGNGEAGAGGGFAGLGACVGGDGGSGSGGGGGAGGAGGISASVLKVGGSFQKEGAVSLLPRNGGVRGAAGSKGSGAGTAAAGGAGQDGIELLVAPEVLELE